MSPEEIELQKTLNGTKDDNGNGPSGTTTSPPPPPPPPPPPTTHNYDNFWKKAEVAAPTTVTTDPAKEGTTPGAPAPGSPQAVTGGGKVSKQAIDMGARTTVATINLAQVTLFRPLVNFRFKKEGAKRFGKENFEKGLDMIITGETPTDAAEAARKKRVQQFLNQRDEKIKGIPFTDEEEGDMEYAWKAYFEMKQVAMSPEVLVICSTASILGKRAVDVMMWD